MTAYVYILQDKNGRLYVGSTSTLEKRLEQHARGYTQTPGKLLNPKLVLSQEVPSLAIARKVERRIKKMKRKDYIEKMVSDGYIKITK